MSYHHFYIGLKVICVRDSTRKINDLGLPPFRKGEILTISDMDWVDPYGLFLCFEERHPRNAGHADGFRPLKTRKTDISIFQAMLTPKRETERA